MNEILFDGLVHALGEGTTRRGMLAILGGLGLVALPDPAAAKNKQRAKKRRPQGHVGRVSVTFAGEAPPLVLEGASDAETIELLNINNWPFAPVWGHANLTARVKAGNDEPAKVAAMRQAIAVWRDVLARHFDGAVTLTDITDDPDAHKTADIHLILTHKQSTRWAGLAICGDDACDRVYVKAEFPPGQLRKYPDVPGEITPELLGQTTIHELGHALGLGHAAPFFQTDDIMGGGYVPWLADGPVRTPVLSDCDLKVLDELWAWAIEGVEPYQSTTPFVVC